MILNKIYLLASKIDIPVLKPLRWLIKTPFYYSKFYSLEKRMLLLNSITKSGAHYIKFFITNYVTLLTEDREERVAYQEMNEIFPNVYREYYLLDNKPYIRPSKKSIFEKIGFSDFTHCHSTTFLDIFPGKTVFLYRNPLDNIVSRYYYSYKNRPAREHLYNHPREVIDQFLDQYMQQFDRIKQIRKTVPILMVDYENLTRYPQAVFSAIINWYDLPLNVSVLKKAIAFSDIKAIKKEEKEGGAIHIDTKTQSGNFVRSGAIGEWKEYFSEADVLHIKNRLSERDYDLDSFIVE
jgi:hypothetical protein